MTTLVAPSAILIGLFGFPPRVGWFTLCMEACFLGNGGAVVGGKRGDGKLFSKSLTREHSLNPHGVYTKIVAGVVCFVFVFVLLRVGDAFCFGWREGKRADRTLNLSDWNRQGVGSVYVGETREFNFFGPIKAVAPVCARSFCVLKAVGR